MKIKLLLAFIAFSFISCSDDDTSPSQPEKNLAQMIVKKYNNGTYGQKNVYDFDDHNRVTLISRYNAEEELWGKTTYEYDQMVLSSIKSYDLTNSLDPYSITTFGYDGSLRIIGINSNVQTGIEGYQSNTIFTYNADNTISAEETVVGPPSDDVVTNYTYFKNADGRIVKKADADNTIWTQAVYNGGNVQSYTQLGYSSMSYMFNTVDTPKGQYLNIEKNKFDGNFNNAIIAHGFQAVGNGVTNYVSQHTASDAVSSQITTYAYEFDEDGYPVKISLFKQGSTQPYEVREISYQ